MINVSIIFRPVNPVDSSCRVCSTYNPAVLIYSHPRHLRLISPLILKSAKDIALCLQVGNYPFQCISITAGNCMH